MYNLIPDSIIKDIRMNIKQLSTADSFIITDYVKDALVDSDVVELIAETIKTRIKEEEDHGRFIYNY